MICDRCLHANICGNEGAFEEGLTYCADSLGWTPVSERLPKAGEYDGDVAKYYLVQNEYGDMLVARWDGKGWEQMYQHEYLEDDVIAWRPLPEPMKAESEETETWNGIHAQITAPKGTFERIFNDADDDNDI